MYKDIIKILKFPIAELFQLFEKNYNNVNIIEKKEKIGTYAPEIILEDNYHDNSIIWSISSICLQLLSNKETYCLNKNYTNIEIKDLYLNNTLPDLPQSLSKEANEFFF